MLLPKSLKDREDVRQRLPALLASELPASFAARSRTSAFGAFQKSNERCGLARAENRATAKL